MKKNKTDINLITRYLLTGNNEKEREMIDKIIHDDEKSRRDFDAYIEVWEKSADLKDYEKIDTANDWQKVRSRIHSNTKVKHIPIQKYLIRIAAILVLSLGIAFMMTWIIRNNSSDKVYYFETLATNEVKTIELPDGSTIYLNKNSKIVRNNDFGTKNRDIILEGEAFFDVAHNENIPFRVHTLNSIIEDLGTSFDIRTDSIGVIVGVLSGKVAFYESKNTENRIDLLPEQTGYYNAVTNTIKEENSFDRNNIAWHTGIYVFRDKSMQDAFQTVASLFELNLKMEPNIVQNDTSKLNFNGHSLEDLIINLNLALWKKGIEVEAIDDNLIVRRP